MNTLKFKMEISLENKKIIQSNLASAKISLCKLLIQKFDIDITDDSDIISSFERDWSNMPGYADYLARPVNNQQCSILLYICNELNIPITISAGKTNLTGSATPMGGLVLSVINMKSPNIFVDKK